MKRIIYIFLITAYLAAILSGCGGNVTKISGMTAVETVQKYFDYWNEKNVKGMRSLEYEEMPTGDRQLNLLHSIKLNSCVERENIDKSDWYEPWYPNPYDFTYVDTEFTVDAKNGSVLTSGTHAYGFWLVKGSKNADWMIVSFGMC